MLVTRWRGDERRELVRVAVRYGPGAAGRQRPQQLEDRLVEAERGALRDPLGGAGGALVVQRSQPLPRRRGCRAARRRVLRSAAARRQRRLPAVGDQQPREPGAASRELVLREPARGVVGRRDAGRPHWLVRVAYHHVLGHPNRRAVPLASRWLGSL
jgi:hypothetical protein